MPTTSNTPTSLTFTAPVSLQAAADAKGKKIAIVAYTGSLMSIAGWGRVAVELAGLELPQQVALLADHRNDLEHMLGNGTPTVRAGQLLVEGEIVGATPAGQQILDLARAGVRLSASVGLEPAAVVHIRPNESVTVNGRALEDPQGYYHVTKAVLREVSLVAIGADRTTSVSIAAKAAKPTGDSPMSEPIAPTAPSTPGADPVLALREEHARLADIKAAAAGFPAIEAQAAREGWDRTRVELEVLRASRTPSAPMAIVRTGAPAAQGDVLTAALLLRAGYGALAESSFGGDVTQRANDLHCRSLMDVFSAAVSARQGHAPRNADGLLRAAFSNLDLPNALGSTAGKIALDSYRATPATWRAFARVVPLSDFKSHPILRPHLKSDFDQVAPGGELKHASMTETKYDLKLDTYGQILGIDRQALINDDLSVFTTAARSMGAAGARKVSDVVYGILMANAGNYFHTNNANVATGAGSVLSVAGLNAAMLLMLKQTDANGKVLDAQPKTLIVPPDLAATARQVLNSVELARYVASDTDAVPVGNPMLGTLTLAVEPRLSNAGFTGNSTTAWYLAAQPSDGAFLVAFLDGQEQVTVEQKEQSPDVLGIAWRAFIDIGAAFGDPKFAARSAGA